MELHLLRLVTIIFNPAPKGGVDLPINTGEAWTKVLNTWKSEKETKVLLAGVSRIQTPPEVDSEGQLTVPLEARIAAERAIETYADLVAISECTKRQIASALPWVALLPKDDEAVKWLSDKSGFAGLLVSQPSFLNQIPHSALVKVCTDRMDGVKLLAEALSTESPTGRMHECVRLFELAFRTAGTRLVGPLAQFLAGAGMGYSQIEVDLWLNDVRNKATHADLNKQSNFILSGEVRPYVVRMQQAAFDVLFNKETWRTHSPMRRQVWTPDSFVSSSTNQAVQIKKGSTVPMVSQMLDSFGAYPLDLSAAIKPIPSNWWCGRSLGTAKSGEFEVHIVE